MTTSTADHTQAAVGLSKMARDTTPGPDADRAMAAAQVHATLAQAAALDRLAAAVEALGLDSTLARG